MYRRPLLPQKKNREKKFSAPDFFLRKGGCLYTGYRPLAGGNCTKGKQNSMGVERVSPFYHLPSSVLFLAISLWYLSSLPQGRACSQVSLLQNKSMVTPIFKILFSWLVPPFNENQIGKIYVQVFFYHFIEYIAKLDRAKMSRMALIKTWDFTFCSIQKQSLFKCIFLVCRWTQGCH